MFKFKKIRSDRRLSDDIADQIKKAIFEQKLRPGDRLPPEKELTRMFGASRITTREALRSLEISGLLTVKAGVEGGYFVIPPDISRVQTILFDLIKAKYIRISHFTDARMIIEPNIFDLIVKNITDEHIELLERNIQDAEAELEKEGGRRVYYNTQYHKILAECTNNPLIIMLMNIILDLLRTYLRAIKTETKLAEETIALHREILEAIKEKKVDRAKEIMIEHISHVNKSLVDML